MKPIVYILLLLVVVTSCKSPEARQPISAKSGSFIDKSIERNIELNEREAKVFEQIMSDDTTNNYLSSENGFWYYYTNRVSDSLITPNFGDLVNFDYNIKSINGELIYSQAELKTQN